MRGSLVLAVRHRANHGGGQKQVAECKVGEGVPERLRGTLHAADEPI